MYVHFVAAIVLLVHRCTCLQFVFVQGLGSLSSMASRVRAALAHPLDRTISTFPQFPVTGIAHKDRDNQANRQMLLDMLKTCWDDTSHILSLHSQMVSQVKEMQAAAAESSLLPIMSTVQKIPAEHRIDIIVKKSSFTSADVLELKTEDPQADLQLLVFGFGTAYTFKLIHGHRYLSVLHAVFSDQHQKMEYLLRGFMENAKKGNRIDWSFGCYGVKWAADGKLQEVNHRAGAKCNCPEWASHITKKWAINLNWDDWLAKFEGPGLAPPIDMNLFFKNQTDVSQSTGPWTMNLLKTSTGKVATDHYELVKISEEAAEKTLNTARQQVATSSSKSTSEVVTALKEAKKAKQKNTATAAQKKAAASLALMAKKRKVLHRTASNASQASDK